MNNPLYYTDPSGHYQCAAAGSTCQNRSTAAVYEPPRNPWLTAQATGQTSTERFTSVMEMPVAVFSPDLDTDTASFGGPNTLGGDGRHPAIDIVDSRKTPISSVAYGVVVDVLDVENQDFGRHVVVEHNVDGVRFYSVYAHLDKILVMEGNIVDANTRIGLMGNSPSALNMSDHLHFEVRTETNVIQDPTGGYSSLPRGHESYWANNPQELRENWVDLGQIFGYHSTFSAWQETFTN